MDISAKSFIMEKISREINGGDFKILELGCGQAKYIQPLLARFPDLNYVGIEPGKRDASIAGQALEKFANASIINDNAYQAMEKESFDLCFSLSVLEHVKNLDFFLQNSVNSVKSGCRIIHFYDLGHYYFPSSLKEKLQLFLSRYWPLILPETKFINYVDEDRVTDKLRKYGAIIEFVSYHQMPSHKNFLKVFSSGNQESLQLANEINEWEYEISKYLSGLDKRQREKLFASVCIWARKK